MSDEPNNGLISYRLGNAEKSISGLDVTVKKLAEQMVRNTAAIEANTAAIKDERDSRNDLQAAIKRIDEKIYRVLLGVAVVTAALTAIGAKVIPFG